MIEIIDRIAAWIFWGSIAITACIGIVLLTLAFPMFMIYGLLKNWRKENNLLIAMALITVILWIIIGIKKLYTIY